MSKATIIAVDFDGTIVSHKFPVVGDENPSAFEWLARFQEAGVKLILWTMRSGDSLDDAVEHCKANGIEFFAVNDNPDQASWTASRKVYANIYIDDAAAGCPLRDGGESGRPMVNWDVVGPSVMEVVSKCSLSS